jgi:hypothetical protein
MYRRSEAGTLKYNIPGGNPPKDWQSSLHAGEEPDLNPGLVFRTIRRCNNSTQEGLLMYRDKPTP